MLVLLSQKKWTDVGFGCGGFAIPNDLIRCVENCSLNEAFAQWSKNAIGSLGEVLLKC